MDENDALSKYNKIPLGHNLTNGAVLGWLQVKTTVKIMRSALHIRYSVVIPRFISHCSILITIDKVRRDEMGCWWSLLEIVIQNR